MYRYGLLVVAAALMVSARPALAQNADTVDLLHASATPQPNKLLALDGAKHFPSSVWEVPFTLGGTTSGAVIRGFNSSSVAKSSGLLGYSLATSGQTRGVVGACESTTGKGVYGVALATSGPCWGVCGETNSSQGIGTVGQATSGTGGTGVYGYSGGSNGFGVYGSCSGNSGQGVHGVSSSGSGYGVYGSASASSGENRGVYGQTASAGGMGVYGNNTNSGNYGWLGGNDWGGYAHHDATGNCAVLAGNAYGVGGTAYIENGTGLRGVCNTGVNAYGIWGLSTSGYAGYFDGDVQVNGDHNVTGTKSFKIDHPLDPENMYLYHSCVESSERMNIYNGRVVLDARGEGWVQLPDWFEAVNCDFLYQLTPIGAPGPNLYIAQEIEAGYFGIAGGTPGMTVCWQVTGTRNDPYALAHPFEVEVEKPEQERGSYLHPELYGMPETVSVDWATKPEATMGRYRDR